MIIPLSNMSTKGYRGWAIPRLLVIGLGTLLSCATGKAQSNLVLLISAPGDYIGQGNTYYTTNSADFTATLRIGGLPTTVQVLAFGYVMNLAAPNGAQPVVGVYSNAVRYPLHGSSPGISITGNGRGCNSICGNFQVFEYQTDGMGNLTRFWATFSQRCECGGAAPLTGEIRFNSLLAPATPLPRTLRVPVDFPTIQAALDNVSVLTVDQVLVDPGLYQEAIQFGAKRAHLVSANGPAATFIMATNGTAVSFGGATADSRITGFTLMDSVTGISVGGSPTIVSNVIVNCGSGIYCGSGSAVMRGNKITGCSGAAIQLFFTGTPLIEDNYLEDNGGGIGMWQAGSPTIQRNVIRRNHGDGMGMLNGCDANVLQNLIIENTGIGVNSQVPDGTRGPWLINNTIIDNGGAGIGTGTFGSGLQILNNIVVGTPALAAGAYPPLVQFNNIYSRTGAAYSGITNLTGVDGNISADPFLVCQPGGDFRLLPNSPCLDAGTNGAPFLSAYDIAGDTRILPRQTNLPPIVDLGAYEFNAATAVTTPCLFLYCPPSMVVVASAGSNSAVVTYPPSFATPGATVTNAPASGSIFAAGTNVVTSTAIYGTNVWNCTFTVTVLVPPSITIPPQGVIAPAGTATNLSVTAAGNAPLRYQWLFETAPIPGATNTSLVLSNPQTATEGIYRVVVTNQVGAITSAPVLVRVLPASPVILTAPTSMTVAAGSNATFTVNATGSDPRWYQWFHDTTPLPLTPTSQLVISNAQATDAGSYYVIVSNSLGSASSTTATLSVTSAAPKFVIQPTNPPQGVLPAGTNYTMNALARGSDPIAYQWRRNNLPLPNATNTFLQLTNVTSATNGNYTVVATNAFGSVTSSIVIISVFGTAPVFTQNPSSSEVLEGSTLTLNSLATGTTPLSYQWRFHGTNLPAQTNRQLLLAAVTMAQTGPYYAIASNSSGSTNSLTAQLIVNQSLTITQPLTNQVVDAGTTITLAIGATSTGTTNYTWQFNGATLPSSNSVLSLTNVQVSQSGYYRVIVANQYGNLASTGRVSVFGPNSAVVAWGDNAGNQITLPTNLNDVVAIAGGDFHTLVLRHNGTLIAWGYNGSGQTNAPSNPARYVSIAAGADHNLAITENGTVVAWGRNESGQCAVPNTASLALSVAAGDSHSLALRASGTLIAWGDNSFGQTNVPGNLTAIKAIAAGRHHNLALRNNGTIAGWGLNTFGQASPPAEPNDVSAIAAGYQHSVALRSNGTVVAWGDNTYGQTNVPPHLTNVVAIAAGDFHSLALSADGAVTSWGDNWLAQANVPPAAAGSWAIAAGYYHGLALSGPATLLFHANGSVLLINWSGPGVLQSAVDIGGPYQDIPGLSQSYTNLDFTSPARFFRLRR